MLRNGREATSAILIGVLVLQGACASPIGPPAPVTPEDPVRLREIEEAAEVHVFAADGRRYELQRAMVVGPHLRGLSSRDEEVVIPLDSIAGIQVYTRRHWWMWAGLAAGIAALAIAAIASFDIPTGLGGG